MNIYEMFGRQSEEMQEVVDQLRLTLDMLKKLKSGEIAMERLEVHDKGWNVTPSN